MKKILTIIALLPVLVMAQKQSYHVGAGATYAKATGYYAAVGTTQMLTNRSGVIGELQFVNQRAEDFKITTVYGTFAYSIYPIRKLAVDLGLQIGVHLFDNIKDEDVSIGKGRMDAIAGLRFQVSKRIGVQARYSYHISDLPFDYLGQVGITYGF